MFERVHQEMGAMRDMQVEALRRWDSSNDLMERIENLLDDRKEEVVAIEATIVGHEERITTLEQIAV